MKPFYIFITVFVLAVYNFSLVNARVITITADANNQFTPQVILDAVVGDTIKWVWTGGSNHNTTPSSFLPLPGGAATWNSPLNSTTPSFSYKITVAGVYAYECTYHVASGMAGSFLATDPTGITDIKLNVSAVIYPNPFKDKVTISYKDADVIAFYNMIGEKIKSFELEATQTKTELNLADLPVGIYFYSTMREGIIAETKRIVKTQ